MAQDLVGTYWLLANVPFPYTAFLVIVGCTPLGVMYLIANKLFGISLNVSYSGQVGDGFLTCFALTGVYALDRVAQGYARLPGEVAGPLLQIVIGSASVLIGLITMLWSKTPWWGPHATERYHGGVIVPVYFYLVFSLAPVIWFAAHWWDIAFSLALLAGWLRYLIKDIREKRLDQPEYQRKHYGLNLMPSRR